MTVHVPSRNVVDIYWSGGWDSTFYLLYLLHQTDKKIRAFYVEPVRRKTKELELKAIDMILTTLKNEQPGWFERLTFTVVPRPPTPRGGVFYCEKVRDVILRTPNTNSETIVPQLDLFIYLTFIMDIIQPAYGIETPVIFTCGCHNGIQEHVKDDGSLAATCDEKWHALRALSFPLIHMTKADMYHSANSNNFIHILKLTTSCLEGTGCGRCAACRDIAPIPELQFRINKKL